jgi:endonuclease III
MSNPNQAGDERMHQIASLLLANRRGTEDWGEISHLDGKPCSKRIANEFLLCCLLDWQMSANLAWENGHRLIHDILSDPDDVWGTITSMSKTEWASKSDEYRLHRFRKKGHARLWRIGNSICEKYDGDARNIWVGKESLVALDGLLVLGLGPQISRMVVGALRDCKQITGASDLKADGHVCRVLGRAVSGEPTDEETAGKLARQMHPDPWQLDWPLWNVGKSLCRPSSPYCSRCYLGPHCAFNRKAEGITK